MSEITHETPNQIDDNNQDLSKLGYLENYERFKKYNKDEKEITLCYSLLKIF